MSLYGVDEHAPAEDLKRTYRELARVTSRRPRGSRERMAEINAAFRATRARA